MNSKNPLVSVTMPCYNHEKYVATAIESVLNQTYDNIELIVADNGSTDGSYKVIEQYADRIKIIKLEKNDLTLCTKKMEEIAKGKYIGHMTSDDFWLQDKIEKQVNYLENNPDIDICSTWAYLGNEDLIVYSDNNVFTKKNRTRAQWLQYFVKSANCIAYPSVLMKLETNNYLRENAELGFRQLGDFFWWVSAIFTGNIHVIEEPLMIFRWHTSGDNCNMSTPSSENEIRTLNERIYILEYVYEHCPDELFIEAFGDEFVDHMPKSREELLCEKIILLKKKARTSYEYQPVYINFLYKHYPEIEEIAFSKYNIRKYDFWNDTGSMGIPYAWANLHNAMTKVEDSYLQGAKEALIVAYGEYCIDAKRNMLSLLDTDVQDGFTKIGELFCEYKRIKSTNDAIEVEYVPVLRVMANIAKEIQTQAERWPLFNIEIHTSDWEMLVELLSKASTAEIDLQEALIPYYDWLCEQFEFCLTDNDQIINK